MYKVKVISIFDYVRNAIEHSFYCNCFTISVSAYRQDIDLTQQINKNGRKPISSFKNKSNKKRYLCSVEYKLVFPSTASEVGVFYSSEYQVVLHYIPTIC